MVVARLAQLTGRPVKTTLTREEVFYTHRGRHPVLMWVKSGVKKDGEITALQFRTFLDGGYLFEFKFDPSRQHFAFSDPSLRDKVDDNDYKFDEGQSEGLIAGGNFGIVTNIVTGPDGNLYVSSLTNGAVYMISHQ